MSDALTRRGNDRRSAWRALVVGAAVGAALVAAPERAMAQPEGGGGAPARVKRPVRNPVIDLEKTAKKIRPGQVVPGGSVVEAPAEEKPAPATAATKPAAETPVEPAPSAPQGAAAAAAPAPAAMAMMGSDAANGAAPAFAPGQPVSAVVRSVGGPASQTEYRVMGAGESEDDGPWEPFTAEATLAGRVAVRTGMGGSVVLEVDGHTAVKIGRLSRVVIERAVSDGREELRVRLDRGRVEVRPRRTDEVGLAAVPVRFVTPGGMLVRRIAVEVTHDAFHGTRDVMLTGDQ